MEPSKPSATTTDNFTANPILQVDYSWRKWTASITEQSKPSESLYTVHYRPFAISPHIIYKSTSNPPTTIGTGTLHAFSINSHYTLHSQRGTLKALKRWKTSYTHLSPTHTDPITNAPLPLTWTSDSDFKTWDFICLGPNKLPIAKFSANLWKLKQIGVIEFMGARRWERGVWDEVVVTGLTLMY
ncbi:MAG: hypothetical protein Q9212_006620, partial [Teloschistes hypoglaucus]